MATTSIRHLYITRLVTLLRDQLGGVQVEYGWPGDTLEADAVYVADVDGTVEIPTLKAGRKHRDDQFTVTVLIQAGLAGGDLAETAERAARLYAALEDVLADDPSLDGFDGLLDCELGFVAGPNTFRTSEGAVTFYACEINCQARYL